MLPRSTCPGGPASGVRREGQVGLVQAAAAEAELARSAVEAAEVRVVVDSLPGAIAQVVC